MNVCVGSSAQQLMMLSLDVVGRILGMVPIVAVEEPGYPTIFDAFEHKGTRLIGMDVDEHGVTPAALRSALDASAGLVLLTPRAQNPTGASWSVDRMCEIADVLEDFPDVIVIENDQFAGLTTTRPGSLRSDPRLGERVIYIRSFSKSIAPDLRLAVAVANARMTALLTQAKGIDDGWTSRLLQRVLANLLEDDALEHALVDATAWYADRRQHMRHLLQKGIHPGEGRVWPATDGVGLWIDLPLDTSAQAVLIHAARLGLIAAPGDPFYLRPGHVSSFRVNAGAIPDGKIDMAADILSEAIRAAPPVIVEPFM